jgi:hypothetical protein
MNGKMLSKQAEPPHMELCSLLNIIEVVEKFACALHRPTTSLRI